MSNIRNFKLIGGFGVSEKEIEQKKLNVIDIINNFYNVGIEEFFVGYNPEYWHGKYSFSISPNGRFGENEQISTFETLKKSVEYIHTLKRTDGKNCEVVLTINGWFYNDVTLPLIKEIVKEAIEIGVDGFIVGSHEILEYLSEIKYIGKVHISTILNVYNENSIKFYIDYCEKHNLYLNRIVFPREVTIKEIENLVQKFPNMNFEVFGQGDYCRYSNGNCFAEHKYFSRDLCTFVLKHGLETKKRVNYGFKKIILNENLTDQEKQDILNPNLDNLGSKIQYELDQCKFMYVSNIIVGKENKSFEYVFSKIQELYFDGIRTYTDFEKEFIIKTILETKKELSRNECKYIYDAIQQETIFQNSQIKKIIHLIKMLNQLGQNIINNENNFDDLLKLNLNYISDSLSRIEKYYENGKKYYEDEIKNRGIFGLETYYKFLLYNRTSAPFFHIFNKYKNIEVVKIPLRGRDPVIFKMGLDLIDDSIQNPEKYINNTGTLNGKYFHYDISK